MKKILSSLFAMTLLSANIVNAKEIEIKFAHVTGGTTHPKVVASEMFAKRVNEELKGKVKVSLFPGSQLGSESQILEGIILGDIQMGAPSLSKLEQYTLKFRIFDLPFLFKDINAVDRFQSSPAGKKLLSALDASGLKGLTYWHNGMKQFSANKPLIKPSDADGLKFRIQSSDVLKAQIEAIGGIPQKMAFKEVFGALQTGIVDGQENTWSNIYTKKFFEVQDGVTETNHGVLDYLVITSQDFWNGLPADIRRDLDRILKETTQEANARVNGINQSFRQKIKDSKNNNTIVELTSQQRQEWVNAMKPVWNKFSGDIGQDILDAAINN